MKNLVITVLLFALTTSCNSSKVKQFDEIKLSVASSQIDPDFVMDINTIANEPEFIPLNSNDSVLVGSIDYLQETKNFFFISSDRRLYKFDKQGNFLSNIGMVGRGPLEYLSLKHFVADDATETIHILDYNGQKLLSYDYDGNFIGTFPVPENTYPTSFFIADGAIFYLSPYNSVKPEINKFDLTTKQYTEISKPERIMGSEGLGHTTHAFGQSDLLHIYHYRNDTVYLFRDGKLVPDYLLKVNPYVRTYEELDVTTLVSTDEPRIQLYNIVEIGDYTFVSYERTKFRGETKIFMAFYSSDFKTFYPNVTFQNPKDKALSVEANFFPGYNGKSILLTKAAFELLESDLPFSLDESDNSVIVRYTLK